MSINHNHNTDHQVSIHPDQLAHLSHRQRLAIKNIIADNHQQKLDIQGSIPLFFMRLYFVFFIARDCHATRLKIEHERRKKTDAIFSTICILFFILPFWFSVFVVLYLTKVSLGIDIFPDFHLMDLFYPDT